MRTWLPILIGAGIALSLEAANAQSLMRNPVGFEIESQRLRDALNDWAQQSGFQLISPTSGAANRIVAPRVSGRLEPLAALEQLLAGTELTYELLSERLVLIRPNDRSTSRADTGRSLVRLASLHPDEQVARGAASSASAPARGSDEPTTRAIDEVLVTGSRLSVPAEQVAAPITVIDSDKIAELGVTSVAGALSYLPQLPYRKEESFNTRGAQYADIRGIGADSTLVLIDGRRSATSAADLGFDAFDLNTIPLAAIERIEVLSDSASSVYGADAIGGVVNVILKKEVAAPTLELRYGAADGGAEERRASLSVGHSGERFSTALALDYFDKQPLLGRERDLWRDQDYRRFGSTDWRSPNTNPGNVTSPTTENLPGLPARTAAVPVGSSGVGLTPDDFLATAGQRNVTSFLSYFSIVPEVTRRSALFSAEFELLPTAALYSDVLFADRRTALQFDPPAVSGILVPAENPFNPFGVPVVANYLFTGIGPRQRVTESEFLRATAGLRGQVRAWEWELSGLHFEDDAAGWTSNTINNARVAASLASTDPALALNVFQDGPGGSVALLHSFIDERIDTYASGLTQLTGFLRGPLFTLPAGEVEVVFGGEWRDESMVFSESQFVAADRTVSAAFAELRIPLVNAADQIPGLRGLSLSVAARHDDYSDFGSTTNPQYALVWTPHESLFVRLSYGTAFRPPSLFELYSPRIELPAQITDPRRNNESSTATLINGGNPDLDPFEADAFSARLVFSPQDIHGLSASVTYWRVEIDQRIAVFSIPILLANEARFPERVVRAAPTPAEQAAGLPGRLLLVDSSRINFGRIETSGIDFTAALIRDTRLGKFSSSLSATWVDEYSSVNLPGAAAQERVGVANAGAGTILRWNAVATLGWAVQGFSVSATARYIPSYEDATPTGQRNGRTVASQTLIDAQAAYEFEPPRSDKSDLLSGLRISVGASNLFDNTPPFSEATGVGYDRSQANLLKRFAYLTISKRF